MKTTISRVERKNHSIFFYGINIIPIIGSILLVSLYSCTTPYMVSNYPDGGYPSSPNWAQNYDSENPANYYYLPDIETYYDLRNREFVYLENGSWRFSASLPSVYASFDLNNCFVVKLNNSVHEPWMHFHYYVAHYPRYYYKSYDRDRSDYRDRPARWFNENLNHYGYDDDRGNSQFRNKNERRQEPRFSHEQNNNYNNRSNNRGENRNEAQQNSVPRQEQNSGNFNQRGTNNDTNRNVERQNHGQVQPQQRKEGSVNREQPMKYYGRQIGQPVKVQRNMTRPKEEKQQSKSRERREKER